MVTTYTPGTPVPTNPPASDVTNMQNNSTAINEWVQVDHVGFNLAAEGQHNQVTFQKNQSKPSLANAAVADIWTNLGTADSAHSQLFFQNTAANFLLSTVKAWAYCSGTTINSSQSFNVKSITGGPNTFTITLSDFAVGSNAFSVICSTSNTGSPNNHIAGACAYGQSFSSPNGSFTLATYDVVTQSPATVSSYSFIVIQI